MYCTAKFGISGFFKALRAEVKQYNVSVTNVYPEFVKTNVSKNALLGGGQAFGKTDTNIQKGMSAEDAVEIILKGTQLKLHELVVGRVFFHVLPHVCFLSSKINDFMGDAIFKQTK
jgi:short-subunit dehydrogenase